MYFILFFKIEYEIFRIIFNFYNEKRKYYYIITFFLIKRSLSRIFVNIIKFANNNILLLLLILKL